MEITILLMSQAKIQIAATMKQSQSNITAFEKSSFYEERDFFTIYYQIYRFQKIQFDLIHRKLRNTDKELSRSLSDDKGIKGQRHLTEKLINKLQNIYDVVLGQMNVDKSVLQLKFALVGGVAISKKSR